MLKNMCYSLSTQYIMIQTSSTCFVTTEQMDTPTHYNRWLAMCRQAIILIIVIGGVVQLVPHVELR